MINTNIWTLKQTQYIEEVQSTLYVYEHNKTKATLLWMKNKDLNKLFSICFKTIPHNDTGVFHILEHSVLCGSKNYPVREPFVELLKSSMNTYLNAMTFPDKTMYPISSRNNQDYLNLMGVYLDAVFNPSIFTNPNIFYQEGWHYELEDKEAFVNGVVYNEMKGAEASVDTIIENESNRMLFKEHCYGYVSGGDTKAIPTLTYDMFIEDYKTYYHPTNSIIYLEGDIPVKETMEKIESYLDNFTESNKKWDIPLQEVLPAASKECYYAIDEEEDEKDRTQIVYSKIVADYTEKDKIYAMSLLTEYLTAYNTSPLKKAILEKELAQDVSFGIVDGIKQPKLSLQICNTNMEVKEEVKQVIIDTMQSIIEHGLDKDELEATLNLMEFSYRDPYEPKALIHNIMALNSGLYGDNYTLYLEYNNSFKFLRESLKTNYYEDLLKEMFDFDTMQTLYMLPSKTYTMECLQKEKERIEELTKDWTEEDYDNVRRQNEELNAWQVTPDTEEALATIPQLELSQVHPLPEKVDFEKIQDNIIYYPSSVDGIVYFNYYFKIGNVTQEDLPYINMLSKYYMNLATETMSLEVLKNELKKYIGNLSFGVTTSSLTNDDCTLYLAVKCSCIEQNVDKSIELISKILFETSFDDIKEIQSNLVQYVEFVRGDLVESGHQYGMMNSNSYYSKEGYIKNELHGYPAYKTYKKLQDNFETMKDTFITKMKSYKDHMFFKEAAIVSVKSTNRNMDFDAFLAPYKDTLPSDFHTDVPLQDKVHEDSYIKIPTDTSYAILTSNLNKIGGKYQGAWRIVSKIITYSYLWLEVRVQGGAYGTGLSVARNGNIGFYSYRDPNPINSIEVFKQTASWLKEFIEQEDNFDSFIISSISDIEPLLSPKQEIGRSDAEILSNITYEDLCTLRKEMMSFTKEDAKACIEILENLVENNAKTIVTSSKTIEKLDGYKQL